MLCGGGGGKEQKTNVHKSGNINLKKGRSFPGELPMHYDLEETLSSKVINWDTK